MINWILLWGIVGVPYFFYEISTMPEQVIKFVGFDIVSWIVVPLVLVPFYYYLIRRRDA